MRVLVPDHVLLNPTQRGQIRVAGDHLGRDAEADHRLLDIGGSNDDLGSRFRIDDQHVKAESRCERRLARLARRLEPDVTVTPSGVGALSAEQVADKLALPGRKPQRVTG